VVLIVWNTYRCNQCLSPLTLQVPISFIARYTHLLKCSWPFRSYAKLWKKWMFYHYIKYPGLQTYTWIGTYLQFNNFLLLQARFFTMKGERRFLLLQARLYTMKGERRFRSGIEITKTLSLFPDKSVLLSWYITWLVTRETWLMPSVELITLPEHNSSTTYNVVRVAQYLVFCVVFCRSLFVFFAPFFFFLPRQDSNWHLWYTTTPIASIMSSTRDHSATNALYNYMHV
jgi:hypothetical protein